MSRGVTHANEAGATRSGAVATSAVARGPVPVRAGTKGLRASQHFANTSIDHADRQPTFGMRPSQVPAADVRSHLAQSPMQGKPAISSPDGAGERGAQAAAHAVLALADPASDGITRTSVQHAYTEGEEEKKPIQAQSAPSADTSTAVDVEQPLLRQPGAVPHCRDRRSPTSSLASGATSARCACMQTRTLRMGHAPCTPGPTPSVTTSCSGAGQHALLTGEGRRLLAHELAHTLQQAGGAPPQRSTGNGAAGVLIQRYISGEHAQFGAQPGEAERYFNIKGIPISYGDMIAMADFFGSVDAVWAAPVEKLKKLVELIDREKLNGPGSVTEREWNDAGGPEYLELATKNASHFAPLRVILASPVELRITRPRGSSITSVRSISPRRGIWTRPCRSTPSATISLPTPSRPAILSTSS